MNAPKTTLTLNADETLTAIEALENVTLHNDEEAMVIKSMIEDLSEPVVSLTYGDCLLLRSALRNGQPGADDLRLRIATAWNQTAATVYGGRFRLSI